MRPVHFEIHAADRLRAKAFYEALFDWKIAHVPSVDYYTIQTGEDGPGIDGGLVQRQGPNPDPTDQTPMVGYVLTVDVVDLDPVLQRVRALGGIVAMPKMAIPGVGWLAYIKDTESNVIGLMDADPSAA